MISGSSNQRQHRPHAGDQREDRHHDQVQAQVEEASSTIDNGITMRGNWILRTSASLSTTQRTALSRLGEEREQHDRAEQLGPVEVIAAGPRRLPTCAILVKNTYSTPNNSSGRISCQK